MIWGNDQSNSSAANTSLPSGNGNAFWEDPSKTAAAAAVASAVAAAAIKSGNVQQNGTSKALSKSQTVPTMQTTANISKANQIGSKSATPISKTSSSGNVTTVVNSTSTEKSKKVKGGNSTPKKGKLSK